MNRINKSRLKKLLTRYFCIILILMLPIISGCPPRTTVCIKDGKEYCRASGTFTYKWYDYYERALSCVEGECYQQALSDLDTSLKIRSKDERMALTYGMHLMDYFPHRKKGTIYYMMGDYEAARPELEQSIKEYPSSKAYLYPDFSRLK